MQTGKPHPFRQFFTPRWLLPAAGLVVGLAAVLLLGNTLRPHTFAGTLLQSSQPAYDFAGQGPGGKVYHRTDFSGRVVLLFFGYTSCPDVCPSTLQTFGKVLDRLGGRAGQVQAVMFSVDPEKDTPARLAAYLNHIDGRILGLSADLPETAHAAMQYGVFFEKRYFSKTGYLVDHTATILLIDQKGFLRVVYPYNTAADAIAADVKYILDH